MTPTSLIVWAGATAFAIVLLLSVLSLITRPQLVRLDRKWRNRLLAAGLLEVVGASVFAFYVALSGPSESEVERCERALETMADDRNTSGVSDNVVSEVIKSCPVVVKAIRR